MSRDGAGARSLNIKLQGARNPTRDRNVELFGWTVALGDKVTKEGDWSATAALAICCRLDWRLWNRKSCSGE
jgi:hypothetical protein